MATSKKMTKNFIHIGFPKTATTSLQKSGFFSIFENVTYIGKPYKDPEIGSTIKKFIIEEKSDSEFSQLKEKLSVPLNTEKKLLSEEVLSRVILGPISLQYLMKMLSDVLERPAIIISIREQKGFLKSLYNQRFINKKQFYSQGHFNEWINHFLSSPEDIKLLKYQDLYKRMTQSKLFSEVHLFPYELVNHKEKLITLFQNILNEEAKSDWQPQHYNSSRGKTVTNRPQAIYRFLRKLFFPNTNFNQLLKLDIHQKFEKFNKSNNIEQVSLTKKHADIISNIYHEDNKALISNVFHEYNDILKW